MRHDERSGSGMSSGPRSATGVWGWDARGAERSRRASGLLERRKRIDGRPSARWLLCTQVGAGQPPHQRGAANYSEWMPARTRCAPSTRSRPSQTFVPPVTKVPPRSPGPAFPAVRSHLTKDAWTTGEGSSPRRPGTPRHHGAVRCPGENILGPRFSLHTGGGAIMISATNDLSRARPACCRKGPG